MIFSVDVEDWQQSVLNRSNPVSTKVWNNTLALLDILGRHHVTGTFFVQGKVAEKFPVLVQRINDAGHEVASHSYSHNDIYSMGQQTFQQELERSVKFMEDKIGEKVIGFRAPNFSIKEDMFDWYCETLQSQGIIYDSSLFSIKIKKYGIEKKYPLDIFEEYGIDQYYLSHASLLGKTFPFFGGGYFRLYPYWVTDTLSHQLSDDSVFYMHPYELGISEYADLKRQYSIPLKWQITQFVGRKTVRPKLEKLLKDHQFMSFKETYYDPGSVTSMGIIGRKILV